MKTLYPLILLAFLAFQVQSNPDPTNEFGPKLEKKPELSALQADEKGLKEEVQFRGFRQPCFGRKGYCLPRNLACSSGFMFKEQFNTCRGRRNKCCLP